MSKILVIGNGFDLALGLKTGYSDFMRSESFKSLINTGLVGHLIRVQTIQNWVDAENELKNYALALSKIYSFTGGDLPMELSSSPSAGFYSELIGKKERLEDDKKHFIDQYAALKGQLFAYLATQWDNFKGGHLPPAINILTDQTFDAVYSFNYTQSVSLFQSPTATHYVHGGLDKKSAVFGIDDVCGLLPEFIHILKSAHPAYGKVNVTKAMQTAHEIHFYGLSFGDTDNAHFEPAFQYFANNALMGAQEKRKLCFHVYGAAGYESTLNRLLALTSTHLSGLRLNNEVVYIDAETGQPFQPSSADLVRTYRASLN